MSEDYSDYISDSSDASNNEFIFKIDLNTAASDQVFYTAKRSTTTNFQDNVKNQQTNLDIVASTIHFSGEDSHLRIITTEQSPKSGDGEAKARDRWIHIQTECISFEEFERRVKILTFDYHEDLVPVVVYLLKKIQKTHEEKSAYGGFIEPGTVFRVDGVDWKDRSKPDLSAIFVSFPYFDMGKWKPPDAPNNEALHLPRGLFQSSYSQENALDRDGNQIFRKFKGIKSDQYLRVPQLWVLILQSRTIITCGPSNLPDLFDDNVRFVEEEKLAANGPSLIQVTDFLRRTTYLPVDRCKTFLGLKQSIEQQCLSDTDFTMDDCLLHAGESEEELIGSHWPDLLHVETSVLIHIRISRKTSDAIISRQNGPLTVEAPAPTLLIEYAGLSSDDSDSSSGSGSDSENGGDKTALTAFNGRNGNDYEESHHNTLSREAEEARRRLQNDGYVVNDVKSLERNTDKTNATVKPTVFKRPSEAKLHSKSSKKVTFASPNESKPLSVPTVIQEDVPAHEATYKDVPSREVTPRAAKELLSDASGSIKNVRSDHAGTLVDETELPLEEARKVSNEASLARAEARLAAEEAKVTKFGAHITAADAKFADVGSQIAEPGTQREKSEARIAEGKEKITALEGKLVDDESSSNSSEDENPESKEPNVLNESIRSRSSSRGRLPADLDHQRTDESSDEGIRTEIYQHSHLSSSASSEIGARIYSRRSEQRNNNVEGENAGFDTRHDKTASTRSSSGSHSSKRGRQPLRAEAFQATVDSDYEDGEQFKVPSPNVSATSTNDHRVPIDPTRSATADSVENPVGTPEDDLKEIIRKEVKNAMKRNDDELETEMRIKLAKFGFQENQIQAMMDADKYLPPPQNAVNSTLPPGVLLQPPPLPPRPSQPPLPPGFPSDQPTYVRLHKDHVTTETLLFYSIPYEIDPHDPNYFNLLRPLDTNDTNILFEHTRKLRKRSGNRLLNEDKKPDNKSEHAFVRRRAVSRTAKDNENRGTHERVTIEKGSKRRKFPKRAPITDTTRDSSVPPVERELNPNLLVPPFLAWPTIFEENRTGATDEGDVPSVLSFNDQDIRLTLSAIERHVHKNKRDDSSLPVSSHHPFMKAYRDGQSFASIPEKALHDLDSGLTVQSVTSNESQWSMGIAEGLSCLQKIRTASGSRIQKDATVPPKVPETIKCQTKLLTHAPSRRVAQWQIARLCNEKDQLISTVQNLVDQFVPKHYPHALLSKCWGSIHAISNVIEEVCKENNDLCKQELHGNSSLIYIVKDFPDKDYMQLHNLENFAKPIQHCTLCSRSNRYPDIDDAFRHLFHFHAQMKGDLPIELYKEALGHWLVSTSGLEMEERNAKMINLISVLLRRARKLLYKSIEIRNNVADEKNQKPNNFLLPSALVKAAEKVFQFVYTAPYTVRFLQDQGKASLNTKLMGPLPMELRDNTALAEHYGVAADNALSKAQDELLLMAHTGSTDSASIVLYVSSTPETTIMIGLGCLITRHIHREMDVRELYRSHLSTLRYAAGQRPSKRILRELYLLEEEIELVATVFSQQFDLLDGLEKVFDSRHYRITNRMRINAFERIEQPMLEKLRTKYRRNLEDDIKGLQDQMAKTAQVLRYNIEIAEEGHSKAILIFTLVTIVFLPLSFVASLLGMNTVDMRSMQNTQVLFWEIALPLTAVIGGVSLLVAYRGTQIGDQFEKLLGNMQQNRSKSQGLHRSTPTSRQKPRDEEDIDAEELKPHRTASTLKRRKATEKNFIVPEKALQQAFQRKPPKSRRSIVVEERVEERRRMSGDDVVEVIEDDSDYVVRGRAFRRSRRSPRSPKRDVGIRKIDL